MRLKDVCNINSLTLSEQTSPNYRFRYIDISNVDSDGNVVLSEEMYFRDAPSRARRIVKKGDTIISTVRTYLKAIATVNFPVEDVIVSTGFAVCSPHSNVFPNYLAYSFRSDCFIDEVCKKSTGVSYPAITASALSAIELPYCNEQMQSRIVSYLDTKTAAIDKRIEVLEKKQEVYSRLRKSIINRAVTRGLNPNVPLKDSGVDWIGMIPEHWEVRRMKDVSYIDKELVEDDVCSYELLSLTLRGIVKRDESGKGKYPSDFSTYQIVKPGDLIFCLFDMDETPRTIGLSSYTGMITGAYTLLRTYDNYVLNTYLYYRYLNIDNSKALKPYYSSLRKVVRPSTFMSIHISIPPLPEQRAIADYLDENCAKIDAAVENIGKQVDALKRLKRALINEVVTGKRKV